MSRKVRVCRVSDPNINPTDENEGNFRFISLPATAEELSAQFPGYDVYVWDNDPTSPGWLEVTETWIQAGGELLSCLQHRNQLKVAPAASTQPGDKPFVKAVEDDIYKQAFLPVSLSTVFPPHLSMEANLLLDSGDAVSGIFLPYRQIEKLQLQPLNHTRPFEGFTGASGILMQYSSVWVTVQLSHPETGEVRERKELLNVWGVLPPDAPSQAPEQSAQASSPPGSGAAAKTKVEMRSPSWDAKWETTSSSTPSEVAVYQLSPLKRPTAPGDDYGMLSRQGMAALHLVWNFQTNHIYTRFIAQQIVSRNPSLGNHPRAAAEVEASAAASAALAAPTTPAAPPPRRSGGGMSTEESRRKAKSLVAEFFTNKVVGAAAKELRELRAAGADMAALLGAVVNEALDHRGLPLQERVVPFKDIILEAMAPTGPNSLTPAELVDGCRAFMRGLHSLMDDMPKAPDVVAAFFGAFVAGGQLAVADVCGPILEVPPMEDVADPPLVDAGGALNVVVGVLSRVKENKGEEAAVALWKASGLDALKFVPDFDREDPEAVKKQLEAKGLAKILE